MSTQMPLNNPASFRPVVPPPQSSPGPLWFLSRHRRAQRQLAQAYQTPDDPRAIQAVIDAYQHLVEATPHNNAPADALAEEMLLFIAWAELRRNALQDTAAWLNELGRRAPNASARVSLRLKLMSQLLGAGEVDEYLSQCRLLLADPQVTIEAHGAALLEAVEAVYTRSSPASCAQALSGAHKNLAQDGRLREALMLCRCPPAFTSGEEAASWAEKVEPTSCAFSKVLKADALLVRARAAEWAGDLRSMYLHAAAALAEKPDHPPANYWLVRTKLLLDEAEPAAGVKVFPATGAPEWERLAFIVHAAQAPSLSQARALLAAVEDEFGRLEQTEQQLIIKVLKKSLTVGVGQDAESLAEHTRICERIEEIAGRQNWFQINIALLELQQERKYESAIKRLEQKGLAHEPRAATLARVARILAGSPKLDVAHHDDACLSVIEDAMRSILVSPRKRRKASGDGWGLKLAEALRSPLCAEFPALRAVADVLRFTVGALSSTEALPASTWPDLTPPEEAPAWCAWLFARSALIRAAALQEPPPALNNMTLPAAWHAESFCCLYGPPAHDALPPWVKQCREFLSTAVGQLPSRARGLLANLRTARADGYRGASALDAKETGGPGDWGLGQLCNLACEMELAFEADYARVRAQLSSVGEGMHAQTAALANLAKKLPQLPRLISAWWGPEVSYRLATAKAHTDTGAARPALEKLVAGPKGDAAKAQLALMSIGEPDLESAEQLLSSVRHDTPAALYAWALLHARRGDVTSMRGALEQLRRLFEQTGSPYLLAGRRLLAVTDERAGNIESAERQYRQILREHPADSVTSARLSRLILSEAYRAGGEPDAGDDSLKKFLHDATAESSPALRWAYGYQMLYRLMAAPGEEIGDVTKELAADGSPLPPQSARHLIVRRLLRDSRAQVAFELIGRDQTAEAPRWQQRTHLILKAWHALRAIWSPARDGAIAPEALSAAASCAQEMESFGAGEGDETFRRWYLLLESALDVDGDPHALQRAEVWSRFEPWQLDEVADLWFGDEEAQVRAAESLLKRLPAEASLESAQRQLLTAASAHARGLDDAYLEAFKALRPSLDELPVDAASLWLAAARIWCRRKNWEQVLESGGPPGALADLADPQVRLVIGMAHAQLAVNESVKGTTLVAHEHAELARAKLAPLIK